MYSEGFTEEEDKPFNFTYAMKWNRLTHKPTKPLSEEEARKHHNERKPYCVLVNYYSDNYPYAFIDIANHYYSVKFININGHVYLTYGFEELKTGKLFLAQSMFIDFDPLEKTEIEKTNYFFREDGRLSIERSCSPYQKTISTEGSFDPEKNYEDIPFFGSYEKILAKERP
jgi:virulence-associated protein VapD